MTLITTEFYSNYFKHCRLIEKGDAPKINLKHLIEKAYQTIRSIAQYKIFDQMTKVKK